MSVFQRRAHLQHRGGFVFPLCLDPLSEENAAHLTGIACPFTRGCNGAVIPRPEDPEGLTGHHEVPPGSGICTKCGASEAGASNARKVGERVERSKDVSSYVGSLVKRMTRMRSRRSWGEYAMTRKEFRIFKLHVRKVMMEYPNCTSFYCWHW